MKTSTARTVVLKGAHYNKGPITDSTSSHGVIRPDKLMEIWSVFHPVTEQDPKSICNNAYGG